MCAASRAPMTSWLSASSLTRSATRTPTLARMRSLITPGRALRGEHESQAERPAARRDVDHALHELGDLLGQRGELVDHDEQVGRGGCRAMRSRSSVRSRAPPAAQELLAAPDLGVQRDCMTRRVRCSSRSVTTPTQCGRCMRVLEGGAALVVDQQEADPAGRVLGGERGDERLEQLALAGAGGAADQRVRALGPEVELDRPVGRQAQAGRQLGERARPPTAGVRRPADVTSGSRSSRLTRVRAPTAPGVRRRRRAAARAQPRGRAVSAPAMSPGTTSSRAPPRWPTSSARGHRRRV